MSDTTVVRPTDPELRAALRLAAVFALVTFLFHLIVNLIQPHLGWGYFRDEFYYLLCGRHLDWGYVDHGPLVAVQARLAETIFGRSLAGIRMLTSIGGAARVFLTGLLAWSLGGKRAAQTLAMLAVSLAPIYLVLDGFLSMNSCEAAFWMTSLLALILIQQGRTPKLWLLFGLAAGLGLLNKPSMTFFLIALLLALLITPQRRLLFTPYLLPAIALIVVITAPNLLWQIHHHWATLEFLREATHHQDHPSFINLLKSQVLGLSPISVLVWLPGLYWLLRQSALRWIGLTYLIFFANMAALHAKDYYPTPIYPVLFAAGGLFWQSRLRSEKQDRLFAFPILQTAILALGLLILPLGNPFMTPTQWITYTRVTHLRVAAGSLGDGPLPQYLADRFGWTEQLALVHQALAYLSPEDRAQVRILCANYGEAASLEFISSDPHAPQVLHSGLPGSALPPVISGHNNYWLWGPQAATGEVMIVINGATPQQMFESYKEVLVIGKITHPYAMPFERRATVYIARHRRQSLTEDWPDLKHFD
jgi:4-amino-4-deoxy-L-arabinose transferase-like glycosyltransferase